MVNNVNRVQRSCVSQTQKRRRWLINLVLIVGLLGFVGFSMIPLLGAVLENTQPAPTVQATSTPTQSPTSADTSTRQSLELEDKARGYAQVLQDEPNNQTALDGLVRVRLQQKNIKGAIEPLEKLAKLSPEQTEYMVLLAQAKQYTGDREGAAQSYRSILASKPGDMNALQGLVALLQEQKRPEAAIGLLQDTLKTATQANQIQPGSVDVTAVQVLLGKVYAQQKRFDEAVAVFDEAIKGNQQDFQPVLYKALVLKEQGKTAEAQNLFNSAVALAPAQYKDQIKQMSAEAPTPTSSPSVTAPTEPSTPATPETRD